MFRLIRSIVTLIIIVFLCGWGIKHCTGAKIPFDKLKKVVIIESKKAMDKLDKILDKKIEEATEETSQ